MKIQKIIYKNTLNPNLKKILINTCKERLPSNIGKGVRVGSVTCSSCPRFLTKICCFVICKNGKKKQFKKYS